MDKVAFNIYNVQRKGLMGLWDCIYLGEHFLSTKSNCEGQGVVGLIGYIPKKEKTFGVQNIRLYRFFNETIRDHLATTDRDDSVLNDKYKPEGVYGFVPTALGVDPTPGPIPEGQ